MISMGWRRFAICFVACVLWVGIQAASDDANVQSETPVELTQKRLDNMQYFGRLGKRFYDENEDKRLDPSMFGRLGKRENEADDTDLDEASLFNRLADEQNFQRKRFDSQAYFGRLGKRYDSRMFMGKLGKRNSQTEKISRQISGIAKRKLDSLAYFGRLGKRGLDYNQFYGRLG